MASVNRKIRLIWDFYGGDALKTAEHHEIHLKQFMLKEAIDYDLTGTEESIEMHAIAYMTVNEDDVQILRDALRPNRAFVDNTLSED
ncbi:MAG: hypothetical protein ACPG21_04055 [Crocinitomicaceae bacterium]